MRLFRGQTLRCWVENQILSFQPCYATWSWSKQSIESKKCDAFPKERAPLCKLVVPTY